MGPRGLAHREHGSLPKEKGYSMVLRAWCAAGLLTTAAAAAQEAPHNEYAIVEQAIEASVNTWNAGGRLAPIVRWDGQPVDEDYDVQGLSDASVESIQTWRRFAERRGYRVDLDESQRVLVISGLERFESFTSSRRVVERVLDRLEDYDGMNSEGPLIVLRAMEIGDAEDAISGAELLQVDHRLQVFEETGSRRDVRAVDARLAEAVVRAHVAEHQPFLSEWMVDGLASLIAEDVTGRAIIDGEAVTLRQARLDAARKHKSDESATLEIAEIGGRVNGKGLQEADAMAVMSFIDEDLRMEIVAELGQRGEPQLIAKSSQETEVFMSHFGKLGMRDLQRSLKRGK